jgi:two-component system, LytTR family, response regulator
MPLNAIIVEDEPLSRVFLYNLLTEFCPDVNVVAKASTEHDAVESIEQLQPQLVFLDIELQKGTGFGVLKRINSKIPHIVFTTAFDHHAIKAIQFSGMDYLQKPIDIDSLQEAIKKIADRKDSEPDRTAIHHLLHTIDNEYIPASLAITVTGATEYIAVNDIIRIEASTAGTNFILRGGNTKTVHRPLKDFELLLQDRSFCRIHQLHLVNVKEIIPGGTIIDGFITMTDNSRVPVSPRREEEMNKYF